MRVGRRPLHAERRGRPGDVAAAARGAAAPAARTATSAILARLEVDAVTTWPCVMVRHGSAGERRPGKVTTASARWTQLGDDQAEALVPLLSAYGIRRVLSADVLRCMETIGPYASSAHLPVESEPLRVRGRLRANSPTAPWSGARDPRQRRPVRGLQPGQDAAVTDHRRVREPEGRAAEPTRQCVRAA